MKSVENIKSMLFDITSSEAFNAYALEIFRFQYNYNAVYRSYIDAIHVPDNEVTTAGRIPFLPIGFFRYHEVVSGDRKPEVIFKSSGTTAGQTSRHYVLDHSLYLTSILKSFTYHYGHPGKYVFLALLPSYLEREGSSLVFMMEHLIKLSGQRASGFYLQDFDKLTHVLQQLDDQGQLTMLVGISFALLDLIERFQFNLPRLTVMETGGMKGRRKELTREELHLRLTGGFGVEVIHSEYGMTELLSQAYSTGHGRFRCPPWMKVLIRDVNDPLTLVGHGTTGGINVIDLANLYSCSFISTDDLGRTYDDGTFEVLGRLDNSDIRGCNLMIP
jgi:hypothetical protein